MMLRHLLLVLLFAFAGLLPGQRGNDNPFEIRDLTEVADQETVKPTLPKRPDNPFEIAESPLSAPVETEADGPLLIRRDDQPAVLDARGRTLGIHVLLLVLMALSWIFFRPLLARCYGAIYNDGLLNQLYRERSSGKLWMFVFPYLLFFAAGGFFIYLTGQYFDTFPSDQPWRYWSRLSLALGGFLLVKHFLLAFIGWLFPVGKETGKYSFTVMLFGIITGMVLIPANFIISYAPTSFTSVVIWACILLLIGIYAIRGLRGLLISNRFLASDFFHFLLYICAVELAPLAILFTWVRS